MPSQLVDIDAVSATVFGLAEQLSPGSSPWHAHAKHQLLYAIRGTLHLETAEGQWLLPPQRAAWIRAGVRHRVRPLTAAALRTVYAAPSLMRDCPDSLKVFGVPPVLREMIRYSMRWGPRRRLHDPLADGFFVALFALCDELSGEPFPFRLPTGRSPELRRAMRYILSNLEQALGIEDAARAAGLSPRTLARRFQSEAATTWRDFLHHARMLRAMELLATAGAQVTETALSVGFESLGSFTRAFVRFTGTRPKDYRRQALKREQED